jgi:hypothetical protein
MAAYGTANINAAGAGVSDIFSGFGDLDKAKADELEQGQYTEAAAYAGQEEQFAKESTALKVAGESRDLLLAQGRTSAAVAGAGLAESGSALDILRENAQQGALQQAVTGQQGLITEAGFAEQQQSYLTMAQVAGNAAKSANLAAVGSFAGAGISTIAALTPSG